MQEKGEKVLVRGKSFDAGESNERKILIFII